jgi:UDP-N-acetylglucosamine acyltransferase
MNPNVTIHPTAVIEGDVQIGDGTIVDAHVYIKGPAIIGRNNHIRPGAVIGTDGESRGAPSVGTIIIGDNNLISDLTTIQRSIGDRDTQIGNDCFFMAHSHLGHDAKMGNDVTVAPGSVIGGHAVILEGANIGMGTMVHQFATVGAYCMIGMNSTITKDIPPFSMAFGSPAKVKGHNDYRIEKLGIKNLEESEIYQQALVEFEKLAGRK